MSKGASGVIVGARKFSKRSNDFGKKFLCQDAVLLLSSLFSFLIYDLFPYWVDSMDAEALKS